MINKFLQPKGLVLSDLSRAESREVKGFTLIETLVAVLLLSLAIAGPLTIASKGLSSAILAKDQIGAYYLAQDALEYIRYVRDSNTLAGNPWLTGLDNCVSSTGSTKCYLDSLNQDPGTPTTCSTTCPPLNYNSSLHRYAYNSGSVSPEHYIRSISIQTPVDSNSGEALITITVQWTAAGGLTHSVVYHEDIFNWQ